MLAMLVPGSPARAAAATPTLVVDNPGALEDQRPITVTGAGLTPGETLYFMECQSNGGLCTYASGPPGTVDHTGHLTLTATAQRYIHDYMFIPPNVDCAYQECGIALVRRGDFEDGYQVVAETVGHFDRTQSPSLSVAVEAPAPLPAVLSTRLIGRGFTPGSQVLASRCTSFPLSRFGHAVEHCDRQQSATADAAGNVAVPIELRRITVGTDIDCADPEWQCTVRLDGPGYTTVARTRLVFDPASFPPPAPTITVSPTPVRHVAATVTVRGQGFRADRDVFVAGAGGSVTVRTDAAGTFVTPLTVQRYNLRYPGGTVAQPIVDCADPGACTVGATTGPDDEPASTPIAFAARSDDPVLVLDGATVTEGNGITNASFRVHLDRPSTAPVTFSYDSGIATSPADPDLSYAFGTEEIPPGQTELSVPFVVHGDRLDEPDHHTGFPVIELTGAQLSGRPIIPIEVRDDDPRPALRIGSTTVRERDDNSFAFAPLTLNAPSGRAVTVGYVVHHDTARAGRDYVRARGTVVIPAGQITGRIPVVILGDGAHETSERFTVAIDGAVNARIADGDANVTIHDDD
jgi:hypothetical protein